MGNTHKILIVDDELFVLNGMKRIFKAHAVEWDMYFASNAEEALKILGEIDIDLIVSDNYMPGMSGVDLLLIVKEKYPNVLRFMLSGIFEDSSDYSLNEFVQVFIPKPVKSEDLIEIIRQTLKEGIKETADYE